MRTDISPVAFAARFAADIRASLALCPRQLPARYFYDELGSALFEAICRLPWYPITRVEERLIAAHAHDIFARVNPGVVVELGAGSGNKLKALLVSGRTAGTALNVHLVDLSPSALVQAEGALAGLDLVRVETHETTYEEGLADAARGFLPEDRVLALFLGSNIGNFDPVERRALLDRLRRALRPGDAVLIGADLVKARGALELAYADPLGVTAAFNLNILARINRELEGTFILEQFRHGAVWNEAKSRVEMHLVSTCEQTIRVEAADVTLTMQGGETIWTESSYKFQPAEIDEMLATSRLQPIGQWVDPRDPFALTLARAF